MKAARLDLTVRGKVQGVRFRASAKKEAIRLGINGFAKNVPDGAVEIVAEGGKDKLHTFLEWCLKGPFLANVKHMTFDWTEFTGKYNKFEVIRDPQGFIMDQLKALNPVKEEKLILPEGTIVPNHMAIIPDGNRRWAKEHNLKSLEGHRKGFDNLVALTNASRDLGIKHLTVWGFSTENWNRTQEEITYLMDLFVILLKKYSKDLHKDKVRFRHLGRKDRLDERVLTIIDRLEKETKDYSNYYLNVALDYGGHDEILRALSRMSDDNVDIKKLTEKEFSEYLDTMGDPAPDLIIRTSGELRLSGLMSWDSAYAELYFAKVHFPDFDKYQLMDAIIEYSNRHRRFGK